MKGDARASVSVIVPAFNAHATLRRAVGSALASAQGVRVNVIIVNDGSSDATGPLADALARDDARVRVVHQSNKGLSAARSAGLKAAAADRVLFLDADDELLPGGLAALSTALDRGARAALGGFVMKAQSREVIGRQPAPLGGVGLDELLGLHFMIVPAVMLDAALARAEPFDAARRRVEDYDLWLRLALRDGGRFRFASVDADVCAYHLAPGTMSTDFEGMLANGRQIVARAFAGALALGAPGVDASQARERAVLAGLAMSWATRAAIVGGVQGSRLEGGIERACELVTSEGEAPVIDMERAAGHAVSAVRMGLARPAGLDDSEPTWLGPLLAWWRICLERGWIRPERAGDGRPHEHALLGAFAERLVEPETVADELLDALDARARGVVIAGYRANGRVLARRALSRGVAVRVRDERDAAGQSMIAPADVGVERLHAPIEAGWTLMLTNRDNAVFAALAEAQRARRACVHSWYEQRAALAAKHADRLFAWASRHTLRPV